MILTWFTNTGNTKYSSYYQYDTIARKFIAIRMDSAPEAALNDSGSAKIVYCKPQSVLVNQTELVHASQLVEGAIISCLTPDLYEKPLPGYTITKSPNLPPHIAPGHFTLIATYKMLLYGPDITTELSKGNLTEGLEEILGFIMDKSYRWCSTEDFIGKINDLYWELKYAAVSDYKQAILKKLQSSIADALNILNEAVAHGAVAPAKAVLNAVDVVNGKVNAAYTNFKHGETEEAVALLQESVDKLKNVTSLLTDGSHQVELLAFVNCKQAFAETIRQTDAIKIFEKQAELEYEESEVTFENEEEFFPTGELVN